MMNVFSKSFLILKRNMIFLQPILLYFLLVLTAVSFVLNKHVIYFSKNLIFIPVLLFTIILLAGMYYISRNAILDFNEYETAQESAEKSIKNIKLIFTGIGEYFFKFFFASITYIAFYVLCMYLLGLFCVHNFGIPQFDKIIDGLKQYSTPAQISSFVNSFSMHELKVINIWIIFTVLGTLILNNLGFFYFAVLISEKNNFIVCLWKTLVFFIKNIFYSLLIAVFMAFLYIVINVGISIFGLNFFIFTILIIILALYFNYYILLVLCFYNERTKINSDNGSECIR